MSRALKEMIVGVAEEVGRVDHKDWDKLLCGEDDGTRGYLKFLAIIITDRCRGTEEGHRRRCTNFQSCQPSSSAEHERLRALCDRYAGDCVQGFCAVQAAGQSLEELALLLLGKSVALIE
jgi:hypothetical protein